MQDVNCSYAGDVFFTLEGIGFKKMSESSPAAQQVWEVGDNKECV